MRRPLLHLAALVTLLCGACIYDDLVLIGDTSYSLGPSRDGKLVGPAQLPEDGEGHVIPKRWSDRGLNYGIDELVDLIVYVGRQLQRQDSQLVLEVGDLSRPRGGRSQWHRSHQTGRDVDLVFFTRNAEGETVRRGWMFHHDDSGRALGTQEELLFDVAANWLLVEALVDNPIIDVQYIFVQDDLRTLLLEHAQSIGVERSLLLHAAALLHQPSDSAPHDDHFHVRVFCPRDDRLRGCENFGNLRWHKKGMKYPSRAENLELPVSLRGPLVLPLHLPAGR